MPIIDDRNPIQDPCTGAINFDKERIPFFLSARVWVNPMIISIPMTIKKTVITHFKISLDKVAANPAPTTAPIIMPIDRGVTNNHFTLLFL